MSWKSAPDGKGQGQEGTQANDGEPRQRCRLGGGALHRVDLLKGRHEPAWAAARSKFRFEAMMAPHPLRRQRAERVALPISSVISSGLARAMG